MRQSTKKVKPLIETNAYLRDPLVRERMITEHVDSSSAIEGIKTSRKTSKLVYLASAYTVKTGYFKRLRMWLRFRKVTKIAAKLTDQGYFLLCPITQSHEIAKFLSKGRRRDWEFWKDLDTEMIRNCSRLFVCLDIPGWEKSTGVQAELEICRKLGIPIYGVSVL